MQAMATCSCLMVALQAGKRLVVNPLLKLKFLSLETEPRLLMLSKLKNPSKNVVCIAPLLRRGFFVA